jgi:hypothetical protein
MRDDEPRPVLTSLPITDLVVLPLPTHAELHQSMSENKILADYTPRK